jgi:hypothetical protein
MVPSGASGWELPLAGSLLMAGQGEPRNIKHTSVHPQKKKKKKKKNTK